MKRLFRTSDSYQNKSANHAQQQRLVGPPRNCDGYPPVLITTALTDDEQVDFYLPINPNEWLACSLIQSLQPRDHEAWNFVPLLDVNVDTTKPVIVICHGFMSWRNQMLLANLAGGLSKEMNCHTIRFDFTGNGHSSGIWRYGNYQQEEKDIHAIVEFVQQQMKCKVACVLGHSKATYAVLHTAWHQEVMQSIKIPAFCVMAGRFSICGEFDAKQRFTESQLKELNENGKLVVGTRGSRTFEIFPDDINERIQLDSSKCRDIRHSTVLIVHGNADMVVDPSHAARFKDEIPNSELHIVIGADHSFNGLLHMKELVSVITSFLRKAISNSI